MHDNNPFRSILIFGPPGAGKGTLGKFLSTAGNHFHLSSGDIFRGLDQETRAGSLYHTYAGKGDLVPNEVRVEIWRQYVSGLIATTLTNNFCFWIGSLGPQNKRKASISLQSIDGSLLS